MRTRFLKVSLLCAFFAAGVFVTGCSDGIGYSDVDGQAPVAELKATHLQSAAGHDFTIEGTLTDADGISAVKLTCAELFLDKTIDLIEIYGEPKTSYDLSYKFNISKNEIGEQFTVKVTVVDVGGRETSQDVLVTMDGDYENPFFVKAPGEKAIVLLADGVTPTYTLNVNVTDDQVLNYLDILIEGLPEYSPFRVMADGKGELNFSKKIELANEVKDYKMTFTAVDKAGKSTVVESVLSVSELQDFEKMYLADTEDLTNDVFGVPMCIDHTGAFEYTAHYYNQQEGTEVYFLPQKDAFEPVCFGLSLEDENKLTYASGKEEVNPIVLDEKGVYYKIVFNTKTGAYSTSTYSLTDAQDPWDPAVLKYNEPTFDLWGNGEEFINFTFGITSGNPPEVESFTQDKTNPHLFYSEPMELSAGDKMHFIIHNYHTSNWWNMVRWCSISATDLDVFGYYTGSGSKNANYTGPTTSNDVWSEPVVSIAGKYRFYFDSHLGRAKLVKE